MPVNVLFCEGGPGSPDIRVLNKLLAGRCGQIRPEGGKYGMGNCIKAHREALGQALVLGLLDGDFRSAPGDPTDEPQVWMASDKTRLGWRWERKEIENYLIDPAVVAKSLGDQAPEPGKYQQALESARDKIALYQAARTALSAERPRFKPLSSSFGTGRGKSKYRLPDDLTETGCRAGIQASVADHQATQLVGLDAVVERFDALRPEFAPGGRRYEHFLCYFAGKDLALAAEEDLKAFGFQGGNAFLAKVIQEIARSTDDIGTWLPEWAALQAAVVDPSLTA